VSFTPCEANPLPYLTDSWLAPVVAGPPPDAVHSPGRPGSLP
jgi:hypothetical protein